MAFKATDAEIVELYNSLTYATSSSIAEFYLGNPYNSYTFALQFISELCLALAQFIGYEDDVSTHLYFSELCQSFYSL